MQTRSAPDPSPLYYPVAHDAVRTEPGVAHMALLAQWLADLLRATASGTKFQSSYLLLAVVTQLHVVVSISLISCPPLPPQSFLFGKAIKYSVPFIRPLPIV